MFYCVNACEGAITGPCIGATKPVTIAAIVSNPPEFGGEVAVLLDLFNGPVLKVARVHFEPLCLVGL